MTDYIVFILQFISVLNSATTASAPMLALHCVLR